MIVTRESNPVEVAALREWCKKCEPRDPARWTVLGQLSTRQAVALPVTRETGGEFRIFTLGARLTPHVRHREKYVDVPVPDGRAFYFWPDGLRPATRTRTLRDFVAYLDTAAPGSIDPYLRRGDFSRWIADVFGDFSLAMTLRTFEARVRTDPDPPGPQDVAAAIRARYDLTR